MAIQIAGLGEVIETRRRSVLIALGVIAGLGLVWGLWSSSQGQRAADGRAALHQALEKNDDAALGSVAEKFKSTRSGFDAYMELGKRSAQKGKLAEAAVHYQAALTQAPSRLDMGLAALAAASAQMAEKKWDEAARSANVGIGKGEPATLPELLLTLGEIKQAQKDFDGAKKALERVSTEFSDTEYAKRARDLIAAGPGA